MDWMPPEIMGPIAFFGTLLVIAVQALASGMHRGHFQG
jgi:hypothetical protein